MKSIFSFFSIIILSLALSGAALADNGYYPAGYWPWDTNNADIELGFANAGMKFDSISYNGMLSLGYDSLELTLLGGIASNSGHIAGFDNASLSLTRTDAINQWGNSFMARLDSLVYETSYSSYDSADNNHFKFLMLTEDYTYTVANNSQYSLLIPAGSIIIGVEDSSSGIKDFNDLIMFGIKPTATPVPAAIWLLGSGVVGLIALRKKNNA